MTRLSVLFGGVIVAAAGCVACTAQVYGRAYSPPPPPPPALSIHADVGAGADVEATAYTDANPDVLDTAVFYQPLAAYGTWTTVAPYGEVWVPRVAPDWQPYTYGHWAYTDVGWTWVSAEPFGWATFHYGRWYRDPRYDWVWVPGTHWAPAWVVWRRGGDQVGWAPLPPRVRWRAGIGFDVAPVTIEAEIGPGEWHFVHERYIDRPDIRRYYEPRDRNAVIFHGTRNVTHYRVVNHRIVDSSIDVRQVERARGTPVRHMRLVDRRGPGRSEVRGRNEVAVYVPRETRHHGAERARPGANHALMAPSPSLRREHALRERDTQARGRSNQTQAQRSFVQPRDRQRQQANAHASSHRQERRAAADRQERRVERRAAADRQERRVERRAAADRQERRVERRAAADRQERRVERRAAAAEARAKQHAAAGERHRGEARAPGRSPDRTARREQRSR
jgi:hypothetical protein